MKTIVSFGISRAQAVSQVFSLRHLYDTRDDPEGPLSLLIAFFKQDAPRLFKIANVRIGRKGDPFIVSYYQEGVRYRLLRNGEASIESADDDADMSGYEDQMYRVVDEIIVKDLTRRMRNALGSYHGTALGKTRIVENDAGMVNASITAVMASRKQ